MTLPLLGGIWAYFLSRSCCRVSTRASWLLVLARTRTYVHGPIHKYIYMHTHTQTPTFKYVRTNIHTLVGACMQRHTNADMYICMTHVYMHTGMTHSCVRHDSFICVTCLIHQVVNLWYCTHITAHLVCCIHMCVAFICVLHSYVCCIHMCVAFICVLHTCIEPSVSCGAILIPTVAHADATQVALLIRLTYKPSVGLCASAPLDSWGFWVGAQCHRRPVLAQYWGSFLGKVPVILETFASGTKHCLVATETSPAWASTCRLPCAISTPVFLQFRPCQRRHLHRFEIEPADAVIGGVSDHQRVSRGGKRHARGSAKQGGSIRAVSVPSARKSTG